MPSEQYNLTAVETKKLSSPSTVQTKLPTQTLLN